MSARRTLKPNPVGDLGWALIALGMLGALCAPLLSGGTLAGALAMGAGAWLLGGALAPDIASGTLDEAADLIVAEMNEARAA